MAGAAPIFPRVKFTDSSGTPIAGGTLTTYQAGTTTLITTYQDNDLSTENENPLTLDANGECLLFLDEDYRYKFLLKDASGATVSGWPVDNIVAGMASATIVAAATAAASASATAAAASATAAATSSSTALAATKIYASTAAGLAAVANGEYFYVPSTSSYDFLTLYKDNAGVAEEVKRTASAILWDDQWHERLFAAQARYMEQQRQKWTQFQRPKALILIALGQSNNAAFNTNISGTVSTDASKPNAGLGVNTFTFYGANQMHTPYWGDLATVVPFAEGTTESTLSGAILMLQGLFPHIYAFSAAYGGFPILMLAGDGPRTMLFASVFKLCDIARAAGYEPVVAYTFHQGEANMSGFGQLAEADYKTYLTDYIRLAQQVAAMAMDKPDYDAPVVFHTPGAMMTATYSKGICNAIVEVSKETTNGILAGGMTQWAMNGDLIHGSAVGYRQRSEFDGYLLAKFFSEGKTEKGLRIIDAVRTTTSLKLTFSHEVSIDTSLGLGTTLNAANALYGIEYTYDGTNYVAISSATASGRIVTCTLASNPGVAAGTEQVRIGVQLTNGAGGTWPQNSAGTAVRSSTESGFLSPYDGARQYLWAAPHYRAVRG